MAGKTSGLKFVQAMRAAVAAVHKVSGSFKMPSTHKLCYRAYCARLALSPGHSQLFNVHEKTMIS